MPRTVALLSSIGLISLGNSASSQEMLHSLVNSRNSIGSSAISHDLNFIQLTFPTNLPMDETLSSDDGINSPVSSPVEKAKLRGANSDSTPSKADIRASNPDIPLDYANMKFGTSQSGASKRPTPASKSNQLESNYNSIIPSSTELIPVSPNSNPSSTQNHPTSQLIFTLAGLVFVGSMVLFRTAKLANRAAAVASFALSAASTVPLVIEKHLQDDLKFFWIPILIVSALVGVQLGSRIGIVRMPEAVASSHALVGAATALIAWVEWSHARDLWLARRSMAGHSSLDSPCQIDVMLAALAGGATLFGSIAAAVRLSGSEVFSFRPRWFFFLLGLKLASAGALPFLGIPAPLGGGALTKGVAVLAAVANRVPKGLAFGLLSSGASLIGWQMVASASAGDMAVFIAFLNALAGASAALTGLAIENMLLVVVGAVILAAGSASCLVMAQASGKTVGAVLFGGIFSAVSSKKKGEILDYQTWVEKVPTQQPHEVQSDDVAAALAGADRVLFITGYGCAASRAQYVLWEVADHLRQTGVDVAFGIHPVAGRMPGQMNVLLSEAGVPQELQLPLHEVNDSWLAAKDDTSVLVMVGASDIANPLAFAEGSPLFGMEVFKAANASRIIVLKRSIPASPKEDSGSYSSEQNPLLWHPAASILAGDAVQSLEEISAHLAMLAPVEDSVSEKEDLDSIQEVGLKRLPAAWTRPSLYDTAMSFTPASTVLLPPRPPKLLADKKKKQRTSLLRNHLLPDSARASLEVAPLIKVGLIAPSGGRQASVDPSLLARFAALNLQPLVDPLLGDSSTFKDISVQSIATSRHSLLSECPILVYPAIPDETFVGELRSALFGREETRTVLMCFMAGCSCLPMLATLPGVVVLALDRTPRVTRAQAFDFRTSSASVLGYRTALHAVSKLQSVVSRLVTPAGEIGGCRAIVVGAGVAGLSATRVLSSLGASVICVDQRSTAAEEVRSVGGEFLCPTNTNGASLLDAAISGCDMLVCCVLPSPVSGQSVPIITANLLSKLRPGAVVADPVGNCPSETLLALSIQEAILRAEISAVGDDSVFSLGSCEDALFTLNLLHLLSYLGGGAGLQAGGGVDRESGKASRGEVVEDGVLDAMLVLANGKIRGAVTLQDSTPTVGQSLGAAKLALSSVTASSNDEMDAERAEEQEESDEEHDDEDEALVAPKRTIRVRLPSGLMGFLDNFRHPGVLSLFLLFTLLPFAPTRWTAMIASPKLTTIALPFTLAFALTFLAAHRTPLHLQSALMAFTNALSGCVVIAATVTPYMSRSADKWVLLIAFALSNINIYAGFALTFRTLKVIQPAVKSVAN